MPMMMMMTTVPGALSPPPPLGGFVHLDEHEQHAQHALSRWRKRSRFQDASHVKWTFGVLEGETITCYHRRADYKLHREPSRVIGIDLTAPMTVQRDYIEVRCRDTSKQLRLRVHPSYSFLQWVTTLYYISNLLKTQPCYQPNTAKQLRLKKSMSKQVSFGDEPAVTTIEAPSAVAQVDTLSDLFYTKEELAEFRRNSHDDERHTGVSGWLHGWRRRPRSS
ncbi:hypothetical protein P43SY_003657 [Pythium insidiosum]|uniref:Uncharacterized protein n=1 Tax=Pythium insidiosum TaxID=114742 RepID=A0AAD5LYN6_PYTIN|nr:hypothetical protein P43SY_003657 [Pythium insidiosum]